MAISHAFVRSNGTVSYRHPLIFFTYADYGTPIGTGTQLQSIVRLGNKAEALIRNTVRYTYDSIFKE
jgi:hypothetical protein